MVNGLKPALSKDDNEEEAREEDDEEEREEQEGQRDNYENDKDK